MESQSTFQLPNSAVAITRLGFGGAPIGNLYEPVSSEEARRVILSALNSGIRYFDTAPYYGYGLSEQRLGDVLSTLLRKDFTLSTKVGRVLSEGWPTDSDDCMAVSRNVGYKFDYSGAGIERSLDDSLRRLKVGHIDIALIHDLDPTVHRDRATFDYHLRQTLDSGWPRLEKLKSNGFLGAIGFGINDWETAEQILKNTEPDVILLAGRYTLLEQTANKTFLPLCLARGTSVIIGGPYNSGILATSPTPKSMYEYAPASAEVLEQVHQIEATCRRHHVSMSSAALQFPFGHQAVAAVIPGMRSETEVTANVDAMKQAIPGGLWEELLELGLIHREVSTPRPIQVE